MAVLVGIGGERHRRCRRGREGEGGRGLAETAPGEEAGLKRLVEGVATEASADFIFAAEWVGGEMRGLLRWGPGEGGGRGKCLLKERIEIVLVAEAGLLPGSVGFWRTGFARVEEGVASWEGRHVGGNAIEACCCDCRCDGYQGGHDNEMSLHGGRSGKQLSNGESEIDWGIQLDKSFPSTFGNIGKRRDPGLLIISDA